MKELLELESPENVAFERRSWRIERVGWLAVTLLIGAALAGLLGPGPLASADARSPDGTLALSYERFTRVRSQSELRIRMRPPPGTEAELRIAGTWVSGVRVLGIAPAPTRSQLHADGWTLVFATPGGPPRDVEVSIDVEPRAAGRLGGRLELGAGAELHFQQLAYP